MRCLHSPLPSAKESFGWQVSPFQYNFYSEAAARRLLPLLAEKLPKHSKYAAEAYIEVWDSLPESILRADFWRYIALFMFGGIYADLDVQLESPLPWQVLCDHDAWPGMIVEDQDGKRLPVTATGVSEGRSSGVLGGKSDTETRLIIGIEDEKMPDSDHVSFIPREIQILTWTIVAAPLHPVMLSIMEHIVTEAPTFIKRLEEGARVQDIIMDFTGPSIFTDIILRWVDSHLETGTLAKDGLHQLQKPKKMHDTLFLPRLAFGIVGDMQGSAETGVLVRHAYAGSWIINEDGTTGHKWNSPSE